MKMSGFRGSLSGYGIVEINIQPNIIEITRFGDSTLRFLDCTTFSINGVSVTKKDAELVIDEIRSQAGKLTAADFYPERVEEILRRVKFESSPAGSQQLG